MNLEKIIGKKCASVLTNSYTFKTLYPIYFEYKQKYLKYRELKYFHAHALGVLRDFDEALRSINVQYTLAFGTLLGAVREHDFIPHDNDIDTVVWIEDYSDNIANILKQYGFRLLHTFDVDNKEFGYEETYIKDGINVDIFYLYKGNRLPYCCCFLWPDDVRCFPECMEKYGYVLAKTIEMPQDKHTIDIDFKGLRLPIPKNYNTILRMVYGDDFMTPIPDWHSDGSNPYINVRYDKKGIFYE